MASEYKSEIRKDILKMLMFQMYPNALVIYREYIQNAYDSINQAIRQGILNNQKDGYVTVDIKDNDIIIKDNGCGISVASSKQTLLDVSSSTKSGQAGMFGIGRLVGAGFCQELCFMTSALDEDKATVVKFDVDKIESYLKDDNCHDSASVVIDNSTTVEYVSADKKDHFFEVVLKNVKSELAPNLLSQSDVVNYLSEVAPVEYQSQFSNVLIYEKQNKYPEFYDLHNALGKVQVIVNGTRIQKQYGLKVIGTGDDIQSIEYFWLDSDKFGKLGWGWFALTKYSAQIPPTDKLAGIRLRIHNIEIGDAHLLSGKPYWQEERGNDYFYGEIHVTNPYILPNSARDGLAPTQEKNELELLLKDLFAKLTRLYNKASKARGAIKKIDEGIEEIKKNGVTPKAKDLIDNKGQDAFNKLFRNEPFTPAIVMLNLFKQDMDEALKRLDEVNPGKKKVQDTTESPVVHTARPVAIQPSVPPVIDTPKETSSQKIETEQVSKQTSLGVSDTSTVKRPEPSLFSTPQADTPAIIWPEPQPVPATPTVDVLAPLVDKLDKSEVWLIRRIFHTLSEYCPQNERDLKLIDNLKKLIVKDLINE